MLKKLSFLILLISLAQFLKAQNEFITVWKPSNIQTSALQTGVVSTDTQIFFPMRGTNFDVAWEEIGYPSHNGNLTSLFSNLNILIDFGMPLNPNPANATYRLKVTGSYSNIRFADTDLFPQTPAVVGDTQKIISVEQWGNNQWTTMKEAFTVCSNLDVPATDIPDLSNVNSMAKMFSQCFNLLLNPTINNWNISHVTDISNAFFACYIFNRSVENWDTSNVTKMEGTFGFCNLFNQPLANWDTSKVTTTSSMFQHATNFNQPIGNWDMSKNTDMEFMFFMADSFNQPIGNWDTSNVITCHFMFFSAINFNQDIGNWDMGKIIRTESMFQNATSFNQDLGNWNLQALVMASSMLNNSGLNCVNYSKTLKGWGMNNNTANNVNIGSVTPLSYSSDIISYRSALIAKGWQITGDNLGECRILATSEAALNNTFSIYPNPTKDIIYLKNIKGIKCIIFDASGRIVLRQELNDNKIDVKYLATGNYTIQIITKDKRHHFKFIKQ
ncbi:BspA family leucine-rich repeat surface protein [Chryseobacterium nepalense]|uniref:BspA family leucine-rich repeat surface protein n=1 Tax=Chryseobacterium nepalense TaxID=1854498 RepID=UPI002DFDD34D|nr:surface protein [Chryseobacterium nepalense]